MTEKEIEMGEYIRTRSGYINKVTNNDFFMRRYLECSKDRLVDRDNVVKHSKLLSEVVEVGDYVNGKRIHKIDKGQNYCYLYYGNRKTFVDYQIKTILTKEQYERNCYKVEE